MDPSRVKDEFLLDQSCKEKTEVKVNCQFESNVISWLSITQKRDKDDDASLFTNIVIRFNDISSMIKKRSNWFIPSLNYIHSLLYTIDACFT